MIVSRGLIASSKTDDPIAPYQAVVGGKTLTVRVNDFPEDKFYTLLANGKDVKSFGDWPQSWARPSTATASTAAVVELSLDELVKAAVEGARRAPALEVDSLHRDAPTAALHGSRPLIRSAVEAHVRGYVDGFLERDYADGASPAHCLVVIVPRTGTKHASAYRAGRLAATKLAEPKPSTP